MRTFVMAMMVMGLAMPVAAQGTGAEKSELDRAFEHYERIRVALAQDTTKGVADEARALAPLAGSVAGAPAKQAAEAVANAEDLAQARERFGTLSDALVVKFLEGGLPGVKGFFCSMKNKGWVQRGETAGNPYYGKSMATCGTPMKPTGK